MKTGKLLITILSLIMVCFSFAGEKYQLSPSNAKVENLTAKRSQIVLNGVWEFAPAFTPRGKPAQADFGRILVPGFWKGGKNVPNVVFNPKTPLWKDLKKANIGWYKRSIEIPQEWAGRAIFLNLERIYNDACVFVDGKYVASVYNNEGRVDITKFAPAGKKIDIELKVSGLNSLADFKNLSKMPDENLKKLKSHHLSGISGDVILSSRSIGVHIDGAFIRTSVRRKEISADVEIKGVIHSGDYQIQSKIFDKDGNCVKEFSQTKFLEKALLQTATVSSVWENPQLWDIDSPTLYNIEITISKNGKVFDSIKERFGFREFEISGKDFLLNGKKIHLQPLHCFWEGDVGGSHTAIANSIDSMMRNNFNTMELWPWDQSSRGASHCRPTWAKIADEKGFLLFYPARTLSEWVWRGKQTIPWDWYDVNARRKWIEKVIRQWKPIRNCPSVVAFMTMPNMHSVSEDQSPMVIGNRAKLDGSPEWLDDKLLARKAISVFKGIDSTRPIASHDGANLGDFHGMNHYLDFLPLQEREEWLSQWSATGTMPYMAIEFGTPFICNFQRDRSNPYRAWCSEPLLTEYCAAYMGEKAYENESQEYRDMIVNEYVGDLVWKKLVNLVPFEFAKNNAEFQALFIKNTWRSWRTWGISGGMIPWRDSYGWEPNYDKVEHPYKDGALGWQPQEMSKRAFYGMGGKGAKENVSAKALIENMKPTLMWIGGKKDAFTDKTHHFFSGEKIEKQIIAINDLRKDANYDFDWKINVAGKTIASGNLKGVAKVAERVFLPIEESLPTVAEKTRGEIIVSGTFGASKVDDNFTFAIYPQAKFKSPKKLYVADETGTTISLLKKFGANFEVWDGSQKDGVLIVGEHSLTKFKGNLKEYVEGGGKLLILGQDVEVLENYCGFRASRYVERRVFPIVSQANHPIIKGFDSEDFRDWAGEGTLVARFKDVDRPNIDMDQKPKYGYHWGNRGSVASIMVEKPHYSSWRAIVEGQFDLAFTPLMEREFGKGIAVLCAFDLAGRTQRDPVADELFCRTINYLDNFVPTKNPSNVATYIGGKKGEAFLTSIGMKFTKVKGLSKSGLVVIGENSGLTDEEISSALENGANIISIERMQTGSRLGLKLAKGKITKQIKVPEWNEAIGLSIGDVHSRVDINCNVFEGDDVALCGTVAKIKKGKGTMLAFSILADELDTKKKAYLRTTAWRMQRTFVQLAGSLGASFKYDDWIFNTTNAKKCVSKVYLGGLWLFSYQSNIKEGKPESLDFDDSKWECSIYNKNIDAIGNSYAPYKGTYWVRKVVFVPKHWRNRNITMSIGKITGGDTVYINGKKVAETEKEPNSWKKTREYKITNDCIKYGADNLIVIRVDPYSSGRIYVKEDDFYLKTETDNQYSLDYIENHPDGDSPFRYMKW